MTLAATRLADDLVLGVATVPGAMEPAQLAVKARGRGRPVEARFLWLPEDLVVFTARLRELTGPLSITTAGGFSEIGELAAALTTVEALARDSLAALGQVERASICDFAARAQAEHPGAREGLSLNRKLAALNALLRERLPLCAIAPDTPHGLAVEVMLAADERLFYVRGWVASREAPLARLTAVSPEGTRVELLPFAYRYARLDVGELYRETAQEELVRRSGFAASFELDAASLLDTGWVFELEDAAGDGVETVAPAVVRDPRAVRNVILGDLVLEPPYENELLAAHAHPAIARLQKRNAAAVAVADVRSYGDSVASPTVSVVVPLYGRTDLMQHQLAHFAHDPELHEVDLIYVLDSPELARHLDYDARQLYELYRIPFRLAVLRSNSGFSAANNVGASLARGRLLLLLNSDVVPDTPGWLGTMVTFYDGTPGIGALGAKLVYEDETIQHGGIAFSRDPSTQLWANDHEFKGVHRSLPAANVPRPVAAVTGACFLIDLELYRSVGGLRGAYVQGDFEDSDLCLRLAEEGLQNWYLPSAELYHLEGQSYGAELRQLTARYNAWLHTYEWDQRIERLDHDQLAPSIHLERI